MLTSNDPRMEFVNYYGNTSLFALEAIRKVGRFDQLKLLSIACLMPHLADYLGIFHTVHHNSLTITHLPVKPSNFIEHRADFFDLPELEVDCVISHAAFHCFTDTRYGNRASDAIQRPYKAPAKLREIIGKKRVPTIISIAVNRDEFFIDNNSHLAHEKFIAAFEKSGFVLQDHFFDYVCGGIAQRPEYLELQNRRSKHLPPPGGPEKEWVVGNYFFT
jgi:hypothetical protein